MANETTAPTKHELWNAILFHSWDWPLSYDTLRWAEQYKVKEGHYPSVKQTVAKVVEGNKLLVKEETPKEATT